MQPHSLLNRSAALVLLASALAIGGAQAQIRNPDQGGPIAVTADEFQYIAARSTGVYRGDAEAVQGQTRLRCSEIRLVSRNSSRPSTGTPIAGGDIERYECDGPVYYVTPTEQAKGDAAVFTAVNDTIVLTGNVVVQQGQNVAQGHRLTINTSTRDTRLEAATAGEGRRRVRTVIYPDETNGGPGRGAAAAPPSPAGRQAGG